MELIGKQIAIETILGQPPELHYPSWYAAQIEKLPPAPPEYLAEQAGILVTDADTISRAKAIEAIAEDMPQTYTPDGSHPADEGIFMAQEIYVDCIQTLRELPPAQPERIKGRWVEKPHVHGVAYCSLCDYELHTNDTNFCPHCGADMREVTT